jgi:RNA polymerase sigma factor (sigma-70 family)
MLGPVAMRKVPSQAVVPAAEPPELTSLFRTYAGQVERWVVRLGGPGIDAEDVVQEVFLVLWRDPGRFDRTRGTVVSWLLTLVHHKAVDAVRREATRRRHHVPTEEPDDARSAVQPSADRAALGSIIAEHVRAALRHLPTEQRQALGLAYYGGYTQREVASITGVPIGTVKSRMFTGVAKLRVLLAPVLGTSGLELLGDTW